MAHFRGEDLQKIKNDQEEKNTPVITSRNFFKVTFIWLEIRVQNVSKMLLDSEYPENNQAANTHNFLVHMPLAVKVESRNCPYWKYFDFCNFM